MDLGVLLREALAKDPAGVTVADGIVTQTSPLLVRVGAASTGQPAARLSSYTPTLSDKVLVLVRGGVDRTVLGKVV